MRYHPAWNAAAVVGVDDAEGFTRLALCLVPADLAVDREALEGELIEALTARLSVYKCPRRFVYFEEFPETATGKTQRFKLRAIAAEKLSEAS